MKKIFLMLAAMGLIMSSCQKDENLGATGGETLVTVTTSVPQAVGTRATMESTSDKGGVVNVAIDNNIRYILAIYEGNNLVKQLDPWTAGTSTTTQIRLIPGHDYTFVAWADFVETAGSTADWHYDTSAFPAITEKDHAINDETRDAYFVTTTTTVKENDNIALTLKRPFGKVRVVTTDWNEDAVQAAAPNKVTITYNNNTTLYTGINLLTGALTGSNATMEYTATINDYSNESNATADKTLYVDYVWGLTEQYPVHFDIALAKDATSIRTYSVKTDVPVTRNWLTTVKGNILTTNTTININVDPEFDNKHDREYTDLELTAINGGEITLAEDVTLNYLNVYADFTLNIADNVTYTGGSAANYGIIVRNGTTTINGNDGNIYSKGGAIAVTEGANLIFNSGNLDVNTTSTSGRYLFYLVDAGSSVTINGGNFDFNRTQNQKRAYIYAGTGTTVYVKGGTFGKASTRSGYTAGILGDGDVIITGGTFGFDPSAWVADGYKAVKIDDRYEIFAETAVVTTLDDLKTAFNNGGTVILADDIEFEKITTIEPGAEVYLNLNGKTITVDENTTSNTLIWVKEGAKLTIDGNGTFDLGKVSTMAIFCPYGELIIENGTFIRDEVTTVTNATTGLFMGAKVVTSNVTINGGYFDPGYYNADAADIEEILAGTKTLDETADDIAKRGKPSDTNKVRVAVKDNVSVVLNHSGYGSFKVYGGTFVGANPAWGDEGCMLPTTPNYLRPWSYYQGALLDGQTFNENGVVLPDGYTITKGALADGRPTYTVTYNK